MSYVIGLVIGIVLLVFVVGFILSWIEYRYSYSEYISALFRRNI